MAAPKPLGWCFVGDRRRPVAAVMVWPVVDATLVGVFARIGQSIEDRDGKPITVEVGGVGPAGGAATTSRAVEGVLRRG